MIFCFTVRRRMAAGNPGTEIPPAAHDGELARHLASCTGCREEQARLLRLHALLSEAAAPLRLESGPFADRILSAIRARTEPVAHAPSRNAPGFHADFPMWAVWRPATLLPALCLMLAAGITALYLSGHASQDLPVSSASFSAMPGGATGDQISLPREIPFSFEEDLVGTRRGTIPLTTYVLEPAPKEAPVVLASF